MHFTFKCKENSFDIDGKNVILLDKGPMPYPSPLTDVAIFDKQTKQLKLYIRCKQYVNDTNAAHEEYIFPKAEIWPVSSHPITVIKVFPQENCKYYGALHDMFCIDNIVDTVTDIHCEITTGDHRAYADERAMLRDLLINKPVIRCHQTNPLITRNMRTALDELGGTVSVMKDNFEDLVKELIAEKISDIHCR